MILCLRPCLLRNPGEDSGIRSDPGQQPYGGILELLAGVLALRTPSSLSRDDSNPGMSVVKALTCGTLDRGAGER